MIKNRYSGESSQSGDDRPRKKLSFRDPEVIPPKSAPLSAPARASNPPHFNRPHSVSGVMGLGGFSASGGVPGVSNPTSSSSSSHNPKGITSSPGIHSPNLPSRLFHYVSSHSPTRLTTRSHSRHSSYEGIQNIHEQEDFREEKEQHSQQVTQKQGHHFSQQQHYEQSSHQTHKEQQYRQHQQSPVNHVQQLEQQYPKRDQNQSPQHQNQNPQPLQQNQQPHQSVQQTQQNLCHQNLHQNQNPQALQQNQQPHQSVQQTQQNLCHQNLQQNQQPQLQNLNQQGQPHEQQTQQKQYNVQSKKQSQPFQETQQSHSNEQNQQKQHNQQQQQQLKNQNQFPQQSQQSQLHTHPKQFSQQQQQKNQNQFSHVQQNQFYDHETQVQHPEHEFQKYHDPQIQQKRQAQQASAGRQSLKTSEKKNQAPVKSNTKPQQSKVHRHHSLSPKRHTHLDAVPNGRNSDQMLFCHSEDVESENQAMKVVRTVGQAFEVVHKLTIKDKSPSPDSQNDDDISREGSEDSSDKPKKDGLDSESGQEDLMTLTSDTYNEDALETLPNRPSNLEPLAAPIGSEILHKNIGETYTSPLGDQLSIGDYLPQTGTPLSVHHELQLLREQLEQQQQQTQAAVAQVHLLRDQLAAETAARLEAQARTHQLLVHNKELLEHIQQLVLQVRDLEVKLQGGGGVGGNGLSTTIPMPPNPPDMKSELSPSSLCGVTDDDASRHSRAKPSSFSLSSTSSTSLFSSHLLPSFPDTPPTPSPTLASHTFFFPSTFHSSPQLSTLITPLSLHHQHQDPQIPHPLQQRSHPQHHPQYQAQQQQQQQAMRQRHYPFPHEGGVDVDVKREGVDSSRRLPQVPEDSVSSIPLGVSSIGSQRGPPPNGPITRAASERYSRQETLAQLQRMAWARHTTK